MAALDAVLGLDRQTTYDLVQDDATVQAPPADADQLLQLAFQQRPDLQALTYSQQAAVKFSHAQRDQMLPSISAAGQQEASNPSRSILPYDWWGGIGANMIFRSSWLPLLGPGKGGLSPCSAASEQSRDLRDRIVRDVRTAWLAANTAYQRVAVTRASQRGQPRTLAGTDTLPTGTELNRGAKSGAVFNRQMLRSATPTRNPIPACPRHAQLPDRRKSMIEKLQAEGHPRGCGQLELSQGCGRASYYPASGYSPDQVPGREPWNRVLRPRRS